MSTKIYTEYISKIQNVINQFQKENQLSISDNPHTQMLVEAFAHINLDLYNILQKQQYYLSEQIVDLFYPNYRKALVSSMIMQISTDQKQVISLTKGTLIDIEKEKHKVTFATCYDIDLFPIKIIDIVHSSNINEKDLNSGLNDNGCLVIKVRSKSEVLIDSLQNIHFYINHIQGNGYALYEYLTKYLVGISVISGDDIICFDKDACKSIGNNPNMNLFPVQHNSFTGYQIINEFFFFPEKYLFFAFDFTGKASVKLQKEFEIRLYFKKSGFQNYIHRNMFLLNCVPCINLFAKQSDPIQIKPDATEYQISVAKDQPDRYNIYSLDEVHVECRNKYIKALPSLNQYEFNKDEIFWSINNYRDAPIEKSTMSLITKNNDLFEKARYFYMNCHVFENDTPFWMFNDIDAKINFSVQGEVAEVIESVESVKSPCKVEYLSNSSETALLSHLQMNYLNFFTENNPEQILKNLFNLYVLNDREHSKGIVDSIFTIKVEQDIQKVTIRDNTSAFCKGFTIYITLVDNKKFFPGIIFVFCNVLEKFFNSLRPINSAITVNIAVKNE